MFDAVIGVLKESLKLLYVMSPYLLFGFFFLSFLFWLGCGDRRRLRLFYRCWCRGPLCLFELLLQRFDLRFSLLVVFR